MKRRAAPQMALPLAGGAISRARGKLPDELGAAIDTLRRKGHRVFWGGGDRHLIDGERVSAADLINRAQGAKPKTPPAPAPQLPERAPPPRTADDDLLEIPAFLRRPLAS